MPARTRRLSITLKGVRPGDDFAGYGDDQQEEGQILAKGFYKEIKIRQDLASAMAKADTGTTTRSVNKQSSESSFKKNPGVVNSAGFLKPTPRLKVYSSGRGGGAVPLPTFGARTRLSIPGIIAVVLLSRFFWVQALVSAGLIALYILLVSAATSNGGGDWLGVSVGGNMDWSSALNDGTPVIEKPTPNPVSDGESLWT